jgi:hypothetical protein
MQLLLNGTEDSITAELAGIGSKNHHLVLELKQGPAT